MKQINISTQVQKERQTRGLTIWQFAKLAGVDAMTILNIEDGDLPSVRTLLKLAQAVNREPKWFLEESFPATSAHPGPEPGTATCSRT
jgi:transcriptional regulator with XRE-family HTH domain